jgi:diaminohydroxyphosphoribosylaminopyrimidine deaminase/5-amino-6-(5-phosphoribosylamino)uracil reductase
MKAKLEAGYSLGGWVERTLPRGPVPNPKDRLPEPPTGASLMEIDRFWMRESLLLSMDSIGWSAPNPAVGCVIANGDRLLASGATRAFGDLHAERVAFESLRSKGILAELRGATAYVTLEPCSHTGRQPPCADLFLGSGIQRIVIATSDPDPRVNGSGIARLKKEGIEVTLGVLENEARAWLLPFLHQKTKGRALWAAKWAETPDGHLADSENRSKWITGPSARAYTHWLRQKYDAILVGAGTWIHDRPGLDCRDSAPPHRRNPLRMVFDPSGRLLDGPECALLENETAPLLIFVPETVLEKAGKPDLHSPVKFIGFDPGKDGSSLIRNFRLKVESIELPSTKTPVQSIFCEGGAGMLRLLFQEGGFDAVHRFIGTAKFKTQHPRHRADFFDSSRYTLEATHPFPGLRGEDQLQEFLAP